MSTKTSIKRIALVAVSALGFGFRSVLPEKAGDIKGPFVYGEPSMANIPTGIKGEKFLALPQFSLLSLHEIMAIWALLDSYFRLPFIFTFLYLYDRGC